MLEKISSSNRISLAITLSTLAGIIALAGCGPSSWLMVKRDNPIPKVRKVVILPFTDDPFVPLSGLKMADRFHQAIQNKITEVEWIGPHEVIKEKIGLEVSLPDQLPMAKGGSNSASDNSKKESPRVWVNPEHIARIAKQFRADAVVTGAVFYDPGTNIVTQTVSKPRPISAALSIQFVDGSTGKIFLAFNEAAKAGHAFSFENRFMTSRTQAIASLIRKGWK